MLLADRAVNKFCKAVSGRNEVFRSLAMPMRSLNSAILLGSVIPVLSSTDINTNKWNRMGLRDLQRLYIFPRYLFLQTRRKPFNIEIFAYVTNSA